MGKWNLKNQDGHNYNRLMYDRCYAFDNMLHEKTELLRKKHYAYAFHANQFQWQTDAYFKTELSRFNEFRCALVEKLSELLKRQEKNNADLVSDLNLFK